MVGTQAVIGQQTNNSLVGANPWASPTNPADAANNAGLAQLSTDQNTINQEMGQISSGEAMANGWATQSANSQASDTANINNLNTTAANYSTNSSAYPSFPNAAGAGTQTAGQVQQGPLGGSSAVQSADPSTAPAYGFSPWSLQGEAMTRK